MAAWEGGKEGHSLSEAEHEPFLEEKSSILLPPPTSSPVLVPRSGSGQVGGEKE